MSADRRAVSKYMVSQCMYMQNERYVGRSAGRHIDRPRAKYRLISRYIIYD